MLQSYGVVSDFGLQDFSVSPMPLWTNLGFGLGWTGLGFDLRGLGTLGPGLDKKNIKLNCFQGRQ